jgi:CheY-like chemotaxis protein
VKIDGRTPTGQAEEWEASVPEIEALVVELNAVRRTAEEILAILKSWTSPGLAAESAPVASPEAGDRRSKTALVIDDDEHTRAAARGALEEAQVPARAVADGRSALEVMATGKPDVVVMEPAVSGSMEGKDLVNMIKATMECVDIPIVLCTRLPIRDDDEARSLHGADAVVPKGPDAPGALVSRVIELLRRG